jgi:hypothetical protein
VELNAGLELVVVEIIQADDFADAQGLIGVGQDRRGGWSCGGRGLRHDGAGKQTCND